MRKLVSVAIVCLMTLTLFGLFGGVVEEGRGTATYDSGTNTIYITGMANSLWSIWVDIGNPSVFDQVGPNTYVTNANITINEISNLTVNPGETLRFNGTLNLTVSGSLDVNGLEGLMATFTSNKTTPSPGDWQGVIFNTTEASNSNLNYLNISYAMVGIYCDGSSPTIANSIITECSDNGILSVGASPTINEVEISYNGDGDFTDAGLFVISSSPTIENSSFINNPDRDILLQSDSHPVSLNSSLGLIVFGDANSNITVKWYLDIYVEDNSTHLAIPNATIWVRDFYNNIVEGSPFTTDIEGYIYWIQVVEYVRSISTTTLYTPHNITVTHEEYYTGYAEPEPYIGSSMRVQINLTMIRRDLTTNNENITFSPTGVPVAGEDLTIYAKIHNIEVDDAQDVRVVIVDNAPEGSQEIHNSTISEIKGNSSKYAIDLWKPTPGTHTIRVLIDPYNEIKEINSNPSVPSEGNNNVSIIINVNARPLVNITEPNEGAEINGTVFINGTAFDDSKDDVWDPFNNITRVDIKLEGYKWVELSSPFNLIPDFPSGSWNWFYEWDTTQWNGTPISDGNYTIQAKSWDNYHFSHIYEVNITINNTGANTPPNAVISSPEEPNAFNVNDLITFNCTYSSDNQTSPENLIYAWDFYDKIDSNGDGNYTNDEDAFGNITTHAYDNKGFFNVTLTVTDEGGLNDTDSITIWIWNYLAVVNITASNTTVYENDTITFNGTGSYDPDGVIASYLWDFDDGSFSALPIWDHAFNESRLFNVTLTVTDNNITSNTSWILINVLANAAPNAVIDDPNILESFSVNETILFNATSSSDPNDEDLEYYWDFGDGTNSGWISEPNTTHYYSDYGALPLGDYSVTLTVRDDEGLEDSTIPMTIFVNNYPPVAIATSNVTTAPTNQDITFDGTDSYDPPPSPTTITYYWDFDDGNFSEDGNVSYHFIKSGVYNVTLTVSDGFANDTDWIIITITNRPPIIENVTISPESPKMDEEFYINVTATDDDGEPVSYLWDFGDGETYYEDKNSYPDGAFDGNTTHSYSSKTTYTVAITVEDDEGNTTSTELTIPVVNTPPEVNITSPTEGQTVSGTITIQGTASDFDGSVEKVEVRIDSGTWILADDDSGDWSDWSLPWNTEDGVTNGQHTIYARASDSESDTDPPASVTVDVNNVASSITVTANLNPSTVDAGGTVQVSGDVNYNTGEPATNTEVNITIQNKVEYWITTTDSNGYYSYDITAPNEAGTFTVKASATKNGFSDDDRETLTVTSLPDLVITASDIVFEPPDPSSGDIVQITITVRNNGEEDANNVLVNAYDGDPAAGGDPIQPDDSDTISVVFAGGTADANLNWDTTDISGEHYIYIVLDPDDSIAESNENNNEASRYIDIQGQPDFTLDSADISFSTPDPREGDIISILVKIHNDGPDSGTVKYEVYDGDPDADGVIIDTGQESIPANGDKNVQVDWTIEESGDHDIYVVLDPDDDVDESDENNNKASKPITVEALPGDGGIPSWIILLTVVIVVVVFILIFFLRFRERGPKPEKELPLAKVVKKEGEKGEEKKEEDKTLMDSHGGVRI
jgi:PKD repeat protein